MKSPGGYQCLPCQAGYFNPIPNAGLCTPCPPRTFATNTGAPPLPLSRPCLVSSSCQVLPRMLDGAAGASAAQGCCAGGPQ